MAKNKMYQHCHTAAKAGHYIITEKDDNQRNSGEKLQKKN